MTTENQEQQLDERIEIDQPDVEVNYDDEPKDVESKSKQLEDDIDEPFSGEDDDSYQDEVVKKEANKLKRQRRQENIRRKLNERDQFEMENSLLRERLATHEQELKKLNSLAQQFETSNFDKLIDETQKIITYYDNQLIEAINSQDTQKATLIIAEQRKENDKLAVLRSRKEVLSNQAKNISAVDPVLSHPNTEFYMKKFVAEHRWMTDVNNSEDTQTVRMLDEQVYRDGYKANTAAYWNELEGRMKKFMPHRFERDSDQQASHAPQTKSPVGSSITNASVSRGGTPQYKFKPWQADVLIHEGHLTEQGKILNKEKVDKFVKYWQKSAIDRNK